MSGLKGNQKRGGNGKFEANPVLKPTRSLESMTPTGDIARVDGNWYEVEAVTAEATCDHAVSAPNVNMCSKCEMSVDGREVWRNQAHSVDDDINLQCGECGRTIVNEVTNHSLSCSSNPINTPVGATNNDIMRNEDAAIIFSDALTDFKRLNPGHPDRARQSADLVAASFTEEWVVQPPKGYDGLDNQDLVAALADWDPDRAWDESMVIQAHVRLEEQAERRDALIREVCETLGTEDTDAVAKTIDYVRNSRGDYSTSEDYLFMRSSSRPGIFGGQYDMTEAARTLDLCLQPGGTILISHPTEFDILTSTLPDAGDYSDTLPRRVQFEKGSRENILYKAQVTSLAQEERVNRILALIDANNEAH